MRELRDGDFPFGAEFTGAVGEAFNDRAVINGCGVSVNGAGSLGAGGNALDIGGGDVRIDGADVAVGAQSADVAAADAYKRYDLATVDNTGTVNVATGANEKITPAIPSGEVVISVVEVPANATIADLVAYDSRAVFPHLKNFSDHESNATAHHTPPATENTVGVYTTSTAFGDVTFNELP
jgi:hypothetical protein